MRVLSLFSGGGLGDYGLELAGMQIVGQVEIDDYCQKILSLRWPEVPKWKDVRKAHTKEACPLSIADRERLEGQRAEHHEERRQDEGGQVGLRDRAGRGHKACEGCIDIEGIDLISGGFPCQDISQAGRGAGIKGERSGLWKEMLRIICEIRPRYVLVENVAALLGRGLGTVLGDLAESGYDAEWDCIPASAVGAPHRRDRVWIVAKRADPPQRELANTNNSGRFHGQAQKQSAKRGVNALGQPRASREDVANTNGIGRRQSKNEQKQPRGTKTFRVSKTLSDRTPPNDRRQQIFGGRISRSDWWTVEPAVGRVAHGVANRVDRLKLLGNGQVVQVVQWIGERIMEFDRSPQQGEGVC